MQPESIINLAGNLSAIGFVIWLAHRLTTKTIPDMTDAFTQATERQRSDFRETLQQQRKAHEEMLKSVMDKCIGGGDRP